jgi:hypothetical protein
MVPSSGASGDRESAIEDRKDQIITLHVPRFPTLDSRPTIASSISSRIRALLFRRSARGRGRSSGHLEGSTKKETMHEPFRFCLGWTA